MQTTGRRSEETSAATCRPVSLLCDQGEGRTGYTAQGTRRAGQPTAQHSTRAGSQSHLSSDQISLSSGTTGGLTNCSSSCAATM
eukprot:6175600-Pleurochrysis_carterae.AAC.4